MSATEIDAFVGRKLKELRLSRGLTQGELGRRLGVTFQQVQKYETGANRLAPVRMVQAAEVLEVAPAQFFEGLGDPARSPKSSEVNARVALLTRLFLSLTPTQQEAVVALVRAMASERKAEATG